MAYQNRVLIFGETPANPSMLGSAVLDLSGIAVLAKPADFYSLLPFLVLEKVLQKGTRKEE